MTAHRRRIVGLGLVLALLAAGVVVRLVLAVPEQPMTETERVANEAARRKAEVYGAETDATRRLFVRMGAPEPGDWLAHFPEPGQLAREYARDAHASKTKARNKAYLAAIGVLTPEQTRCVAVMREYVQVFFDCPTEAVALPFPDHTMNAARAQADAKRVLAWLTKRRPADALVYAGVTGVDLYREGLNFVFGIGRVNGVLGVYSLHRYGRDERTLLRRALKVANHEIGHILGLRHCIFYQCAMNGSNSLAESDRRPIHYCPECHEKLRLAIGFKPADRLRKLAAFYKRIGFHADAAFVEQRIAAPPR